MKRPFMWAVIMFVLGEVLRIEYQPDFSTVLTVAVAIACIVYYVRKRYFIFLIILTGSLFLGLKYADYNIENRIIEGMYESENSQYSICEDTKVICEGRIVDIGDETITVKVHKTFIAENERNSFVKLNQTYSVKVYDFKERVLLGSSIRLSGYIKCFSSPTSPGAFDAKIYYLTKGISFIFSCEEYIVGEDFDIFAQGVRDFKEASALRLKHLCSAEYYPVYKSILLGDKSDLDAEQKNLYQLAGISHLFAISGLHVSIVGGIVIGLLRLLGVPRYVSTFLSIPIIILYGYMTGFSVSTIRAIIMLILARLGELLKKDYDILTGAALALLIVLLENPFRIYDSGMWLSFGAVLGVCLAGYIDKLIKPYIEKIPVKGAFKLFLSYIISAVLFSLCINIVTFPIIVNTYYQISLFSPFINLIVLPFMTIVLLCGMLGLLINSTFLMSVGELVLKLYDKLCEQVLHIPESVLNIGKVSWVYLAAYVLLVILLIVILTLCLNKDIRLGKKNNHSCYRYKVAIFLSLFWFSSAFSLIYISWADDREKIVFLDVGQGLGVLIKTDAGTNIVIDGGSSSKKEVGRVVIVPAIRYYGMSQIDYWFVTHGDADHINGLIEILEAGITSGVSIEHIVISRWAVYSEELDQLIQEAQKNEVDIIYMTAGQYVSDGSFRMECLYPGAESSKEERVYMIEDYQKTEGEYKIKELEETEGEYKTKEFQKTEGEYKPKKFQKSESEYKTKDYQKTEGDINELSMCLGYISDTESVLFTGDIGVEGLKKLRLKETYRVLQVPHHGSKNSYDKDFYENCECKIAIVSCGRNNLYGHPHKEVVDGIHAVGGIVFRTDERGTIMLVPE